METTASITVRELVGIPYLRTTVQAGGAGLDRQVRFAHACEMPAPWEWLGTGDLLLTSGIGLPAQPAAQAEYVRRLADAGLSGMSIGEGAAASGISARMAQEADRRRFPILLTAYEVPWVALSRAVAEAGLGRAHERLVVTARLYDRARESTAAGERPGALFETLGEELGCQLAIVDADGGRPLLAGGGLSDSLRAALQRAVAEHGDRIPAFMRVRADGRAAIAVPAPSRQGALLVAVPRPDGGTPDVALLHHVAVFAAIEVERAALRRADGLRRGAELLAELLDTPMDPAVADRLLAEHGFATTEPLALAAWRVEADGDAESLQDALAEAGMPHLLLRRADCTVTLIAECDASLDGIAAALHPDARAGVSDGFSHPAQASDALLQARWALQAALGHDGLAVRYGEQHAPFLPRTVTEAQAAVRRVLGALLDYDRDHGTELVATLDAFLRANRSWKRAAEQLFVHKQTLVYRVRRIEEITGTKLDDTEHVAELWFALRSLTVHTDPGDRTWLTSRPTSPEPSGASRSPSATRSTRATPSSSSNR